MRYVLLMLLALAACGGGDPEPGADRVAELAAKAPRAQAQMCLYGCGFQVAWVNTSVYVEVTPVGGALGVGVDGTFNGGLDWGMEDGGTGIVGDIAGVNFSGSGSYLATDLLVYVGTDNLVRTVDITNGVNTTISTVTMPNPSPDGKRRIPLKRRMMVEP
jgi:hypothetical protein